MDIDCTVPAGTTHAPLADPLADREGVSHTPNDPYIADLVKVSDNRAGTLQKEVERLSAKEDKNEKMIKRLTQQVSGSSLDWELVKSSIWEIAHLKANQTTQDGGLQKRNKQYKSQRREDGYLSTFLLNWGRLQIWGKQDTGWEFQSYKGRECLAVRETGSITSQYWPLGQKQYKVVNRERNVYCAQ